MSVSMMSRIALLVVVASGVSVLFQNCGAGFELSQELSESSKIDLPQGTSQSQGARDMSCTFDGQPIADGNSVTAYATSTVGTGVTCRSESRVCMGGHLSGSFAYSSCSEGAKASCLFDGKTILDGLSVAAFTSSTVPHGADCAPLQEVRVCRDGALSGSASYAACVAGQPKSCLFGTKTIASGEGVSAFRLANAPTGLPCSSLLEERICSDGALSGSFSYSSCTETPDKSCLFAGQTIVHGASVTAYSASSVPAAGNCASVTETRGCNQGTLSGTFAYATCAVATPRSCLFNGTTIPHGQSTKGYRESVATAGATCASEDRLCQDGTLTGTYAAATCTQQDIFVTTCQARKAAGETKVARYVAFKAQQSSLNQPCHYEERVCEDGQTTGTYQATQCLSCHDNVNGRYLNGDRTRVCFLATVKATGILVSQVEGVLSALVDPIRVLSYDK